MRSYCYLFVFRMAPLISRQAIFEVWSVNSKTERCDAVYGFVLQQFGEVIFHEYIISYRNTFQFNLTLEFPSLKLLQMPQR